MRAWGPAPLLRWPQLAPGWHQLAAAGCKGSAKGRARALLHRHAAPRRSAGPRNASGASEKPTCCQRVMLRSLRGALTSEKQRLLQLVRFA